MRSLLLSLFIFIATSLPLWSQNYSLEEVKEIISQSPISRIEGLWLMPDSDITVWIRAVGNLREYDVIAVDSPDASIDPGDVIGHVKASTLPEKFELKLFTIRNLAGFGKPKTFTATLTAGDESLTLDSPSAQIRINPLGMLPYIRSIFRIYYTKNQVKPPYGLIRIYPSYDGNGSSRFHPRYL